jgi:Domain of unknown function (DUF4258)
MPVTLTMRWLYYFLLVIFLSDSCHTSSEPFDRHGYLILTKHARCRMDCRHITMKEIQEILDKGTINYTKSEPDAHPDPKFAMEGFTEEHQHLRIIIAPENGKLILVTCIELGVEWQCDCN